MCFRLSTPHLPYISTLKGIFLSGQRDSPPYTNLSRTPSTPDFYSIPHHQLLYIINSTTLPSPLRPWQRRALPSAPRDLRAAAASELRPTRVRAGHELRPRRRRPPGRPRARALRDAASLGPAVPPLPSATRPRSGRRRRPCPSRRRRAPGPRRRPSPLRRRRAPGRPRAPPLCAAASLGPAAPPLPSAPRPGSGRRRRPCAPCRCRAPGPPPPTIVRSVASSTRGGGGGEAGWHGDGRGADLRASTTSATPATSARLAPPPVLSLLSVRARQRLGAIGRAHTDGRRGDVSLTSKVELWRLSSTVEV